MKMIIVFRLELKETETRAGRRWRVAFRIRIVFRRGIGTRRLQSIYERPRPRSAASHTQPEAPCHEGMVKLAADGDVSHRDEDSLFRQKTLFLLDPQAERAAGAGTHENFGGRS